MSVARTRTVVNICEEQEKSKIKKKVKKKKSQKEKKKTLCIDASRQ